MATTSTRPRGEDRWEPLPKIAYGFAIYPFAPASSLPTSSSRTSTHSNGSHAESSAQGGAEASIALMADLEVGDEVYAFERYVPRHGGERNMWYRGYVVASTKTPSASSLLSSSDPSSSSSRKPLNNPSPTNAEPSVCLGIFPANFIHVREELNDAEGRLSTVWDDLHHPKSSSASSDSAGGGGGSSKGKGKARKTRQMEALTEEEEDDKDGEGSTRRRREEEMDGDESKRPSRNTEEEEERRRPREKLPPPIPSLKAGDETVSGATEALVDEISTASREWYSRMFTYLLTRNYRLFHIVRQHITSLHVGRRHLLDRNLGTEELSILRRDCVARLVKGNVAQGLDVIVRHPVSGGLVTVSGTDGLGEVDSRSWVSGIRMYSMQVASAYIDASSTSQPLGNGLDLWGKNALGVPSSTSKSSILPQPTEFSTLPSRHSISLSQHSNSLHSSSSLLKKQPHQPLSSDEPLSGDFFHLFIELRAFVANPCMPSETSELHFALYSRSINQYISEEFLVVMNSHGMPVADTEAEGLGKRVRTLFRDLGPQDVGEVVLVCRIVRCGAMKMGAVGGSLGSSGSSIRSSSASSMNEQQPDTSSASNGRSSGGHFLQPPSNLQQHHSSSSRSNKTSTVSFRRPFGCAVVDVSQFVKGAEDATTKPREVPMQIFVPVDEANFATLHEDIIQSRTSQFERSPRADMIAIDLKFFFGQTPAIVKDNPSLVQGCPQTQRLGFPDVVFPGSTRNDLYVKLWSADFNGSGGGSIRMRKGMSSFGVGAASTTSQSYQVNVEVRTREGISLDRSISRGAGEPPVRTFSSLVFGRNVTPTFGELIKISNIPVEIMAGCHLYFTFRQRAPIRDKSTPSDSTGLERPFAFAYLPLVPEEGASFVPDGDHTLVLYRIDKPIQLPLQYLEAPSSLSYGSSIETLRIPSHLARVLVPLRDSMTIRSFLCSTAFTQSEVLLRLLNWEKSGLLENTTELTAVLSQFRFVSEVEVVKVLGPIFDSLFAIMVANPSERVAVEGLVFEALITVLGIVQDRRFMNFKPVLDAYIDKHFSSASVWNQLIRSMSGLLADKSSKQLRAAIKVWHYVFRFISRSRDLQKYKDAGMGGTSERLREHLDSSFKSGLALLLRDFNDLMTMTEPSSIIGTQTIALQHFSDILPDLARTFDAQELATIVISFSDAVPRPTGKAVIFKLLLHLQSARSVVFDDPEARASLVPALVRWIKPHLGRYQESALVSQTEDGPSRDNARIAWVEALRLAVTVVAVVLDKLSEAVTSPSISKDRNALNGERDNIDLVFSCFPMLLESYHELRNSETLEVIDRHRSVATVAVPIPVVFPSTYPFSLVAHRPEQRTANEGSESTSEAPTGLNIALGEIAVVICVLINIQPHRALQMYLEEQIEVEGLENVNRMLSSFFRASSSILAFDAFPSNWINCSVMAHNSILKLADEAGRVMQRCNIPEDSDASSFDSFLWKSCFDTMFALLSSEEVVIEAFGPQKRRAVWKLAGDIRGDGVLVLHRLWDSIGWPSLDKVTVSFGRYQVQFLSLVQPVLTLCLSQHDMLRTRAVQILYTMILSEWSLQGNFRQVESEVIDKLDELMEKDNDGDNHTRDYFVSALRLLFSGPSVDLQLQEAVTTWLNSVDQFLKLLISLRDLPDGEEYQDDRVVSTLRLLNFLRSVGGRDTMYINYVHQLVAAHVRSGDFTEAGLTLKLHASLYEWNRNAFVEPFVYGELELPRQSQFGRKESLYLQTLDYLGRGKAFELAIEVSKELEYQHQNTTFDYARLAELLSHHSRLLESIVSEPRPYPHYFMVNYFGPFPLAVRGQRFVYRGSEWQKFGGFCDQLQNKHPQAKLIKSIILPDHVENGEDLYIQVLAVQPEPDKSLPVFNPAVAKGIRTYYETSNVNVFSHSRPFNKSGRVGGERDIADVFIEKTFITCQESFPTVLRRSEIKSTRTVEISSIASAVADVKTKTEELEALEESYTALSETGEELNTNPLSMALNGAVDAPMNGGVPAYRQAFFSAQFIAQNPDKSHEIESLRAAIEDQTRVLARCLDLHSLVCPEAMMPFHLTIEQFFHRTFAEEISRIGIALPVGLGDEAPSALGVAAQRHREERARSASFKAIQSPPVRVTDFLSSSNYTNGGGDRDRQSTSQSRISADARSIGSTTSSPGRRLSSIGSLVVGAGRLPRASNGSEGREASGNFLSPSSSRLSRSEGELSDSGVLSRSSALGKKDGSSLGRFSSLMRRKEPKRNGA
ncbi:hypothetical protein BDY24DRAFT_382988 [Mrakia frigida]|uniref:guanine nucleotide exchange factor DCK1 n=1 Tax=Mrakia frigida TaxID=29902 RepID=UPI003FCC1B56